MHRTSRPASIDLRAQLATITAAFAHQSKKKEERLPRGLPVSQAAPSPPPPTMEEAPAADASSALRRRAQDLESLKESREAAKEAREVAKESTCCSIFPSRLLALCTFVSFGFFVPPLLLKMLR